MELVIILILMGLVIYFILERIKSKKNEKFEDRDN